LPPPSQPPRRTGRNDAAALVAGAGTDVDDPVAARDDVHVVLDHDDGVARLHETVELRHELLHVGGMQTRRGLVENVQRVASLRALQLGGKLDALCLAAGELGRRLSEAKISEPTSRKTPSERRTCGSSAKNSHAASTVRASTSAMFLSRYRIFSVSAL
jgi:hypothetical protein